MQVYKAIKYIRLSYTDDKTVESDSVANQRRLIDDYIARHPEIEVVAEKIDDGYSGVLFDRPAFQEMMRMIEQGEANCVIVKDLSRLGREYIETGRYMRRVFPAYGVRFIAINDNVDTENDAADDLTVSVKNIMNEACISVTCVIYNLHVVGKKSLIDIPHWPEHYEVLSYHFWPAYRQNRLSVFVPEDRCIPLGEI